MSSIKFTLFSLSFLLIHFYLSSLSYSSTSDRYSPFINTSAVPVINTKVTPQQFDEAEREALDSLLGPEGNSAAGKFFKNYKKLEERKILLQEEEVIINGYLGNRFENREQTVEELISKITQTKVIGNDLPLKYQLPGNWGGLDESETRAYWEKKETENEAPCVTILYAPVFTKESENILQIRNADSSAQIKPRDVLNFEKSLEGTLNNFHKFFRADLDIFNFNTKADYQKKYDFFEETMASVRKAIQTFWLGEQMLVRRFAYYHRENDPLKRKEKNEKYSSFAGIWFIDSKGNLADALAMQAMGVGILNAKVMLKHLLLRQWTPDILAAGLTCLQKELSHIRLEKLLNIYSRKTLNQGLFQILAPTRKDVLVEGAPRHFYKILTNQYFPSLLYLTQVINEKLSEFEKLNSTLPQTEKKSAGAYPMQPIISSEEDFLLNKNISLFNPIFTQGNSIEKAITMDSFNEELAILNEYEQVTTPLLQKLSEEFKILTAQHPFLQNFMLLTTEVEHDLSRYGELWVVLAHTYLKNQQDIVDEEVKQFENALPLAKEGEAALIEKNNFQTELKEFIVKVRSEIRLSLEMRNKALKMLNLISATYTSRN